MVRFAACALAAGLLLWGGLTPRALASVEDEVEVRVRLLGNDNVERLELEAEEGELTLYAGSPENILMSVEDEPVAISRRGEELRVETGDGEFFTTELGVAPAGDAAVQLHVRESERERKPRSYPGRLMIGPESGHSAALRIINQVPLEEYVASVVSAEYGFDDVEGAKAMAVLVRTYALRNKFGEEYDHVDHVISQAYRGTTALTEAAVEATRETQGQVLTYDDDLIEAVYFSSSGGHTANNEDVWDGAPLPYLRGRNDPHDSASPHSEWEARVSREALLDALSTNYDASVEGFVIDERSDEGRVRSVELLTGQERRSVRASEFRSVINRSAMTGQLKSTFFEARREGDDYVFSGQGFGHGVGLSQYGARELSRQGQSYEEILDYYFADVTLEELDDLPHEFDMPLITEAPLPDAPPGDVEETAEEEEQTEAEPKRERRRIGW